MSLSKSNIATRLKQNGYKPFELNNNVFYVPSKNRKFDLTAIHGMFLIDGAQGIPKSKHSATGEVKIGAYSVVVTRQNYSPAKPQTVQSQNESVQNRTSFGIMLLDVIANTLAPINIQVIGNGRTTLKGITTARFSGKGVGDFVLIKAPNTLMPLTINLPHGSYREKITKPKYLDKAQDALERVAMLEELDATMVGDKMTLNSPVVYPADSGDIRDLIFSDIRGGLGIMGEFEAKDFRYDGTSNTLIIKADRVFANQPDMKTEDKPYFVISNGDGSIGELEGLELNLIPKRSLPRRLTMTTI